MTSLGNYPQNIGITISDKFEPDLLAHQNFLAATYTDTEFDSLYNLTGFNKKQSNIKFESI
jgi:hypothetical protein